MKKPTPASFSVIFPPRDARLPGILLLFCLPYALFTYWFYPAGSVHRGLVINIVLAAIPLLPMFLLTRRKAQGKHGIAGALWWVLWLAFFPNVPYLFTDLIHIQNYSFNTGATASPSGLAWVSLFHILAAVTVGAVLGYYSLYRLHLLAQTAKNTALGWLFVAAASLLSGIGIYIGRFLRFNTWDIVQRPCFFCKHWRGSFRQKALRFAFYLPPCPLAGAEFFTFAGIFPQSKIDFALVLHGTQ